MYGLKQAPRQWHKKFESFMLEHGFHKTQAGHSMFVKRYNEGDFLILLLYVDDMLELDKTTRRLRASKKHWQVVFHESYWTGEANPGYAHSSGQNKLFPHHVM